VVEGITTHGDRYAARWKSELISATDYYSADYFAARKRFLAACTKSGLQHYALHIHARSPRPEPLTIDIAIAGAKKPTTALVLSSGVHGVEGLFGSAVQLAFLERFALHRDLPLGAAVVLIHAVNPFGFAWQRRLNEENVDLNRNFLLPDEPYAGSPPLAGEFRRAMTPGRPRRGFGFWTARMAFLALRYGIRSFWETLPVGQYDYPDWLYYGGGGPTQSLRALELFLPTLLDEANEVVHLDFHTGLGRWAKCELLVPKCDERDNCAWWIEHFETDMVRKVKSFTHPYELRGGFGPWLRALFPHCQYRYATAEFGTYSPLRVISALAEELRWHAELDIESPLHSSRQKLADMFVPRSRRWRTKALRTGVVLAERAAGVLWKSKKSPAVETASS
jgi:predicted deacylase